MKAVNVKTIKSALESRTDKELMELVLRLSTFKKENKELLTYLLFESHDEEAYIESVKAEIDAQFDNINKKSYFYIRKSMRKILTMIKKYVRYSKNKETELILLLYYCNKLKRFTPSIKKSVRIKNIYNRQLGLIKKIIGTLHEDLQYDYGLELEELEGF